MTSYPEGKGLQGLNITVKDKKSTALISYALTRENGSYEISFKSPADSLVISVSGFNVEKKNREVINRNQQVDFQLKASAIKLKEIKVNPPKIRKLNDTLNYLVEGFKDNSDRTIGDVLKKMPGIEVKADGIILYNNKPINKFYIENKDLLQGRYGIATNNIEAKDVAAVQVMENHQPIKALKNREFTDEAALNLKLTDEAKGVLIANTKLAAGLAPVLWDNELISMYFNKERQSMNTYKGNNIGEDPATEFKSFYQQAEKTNAPFLSVQSPSSPAISQHRYLFNRAHAFSTNNLWSLGKDKQLNLTMAYLNDLQQKSSFSRSVYYLNADSILTIEERLASAERINQLNAALQYNANKEDYYLDHTLSFSGSRNHSDGSVRQQDTILQHVRSPSFALENTLNMVKNYKKRSLKIYSYQSYKSVKQTLAVSPMLYPDLFGGENLDATVQDYGNKQFTTNNKLSFGLSAEHWKQSYNLGVNINLQQLNSELSGRSPVHSPGADSFSADSLRNDFNWGKYQLYFSPDYTYTTDQFRISANLPLSYNYLHTDDQLARKEQHLDRLYFNPTFSVNYNINLFLSMTAAAAYSNKMGEIGDAYTGFLMQTYRNLSRNDGSLPEQKTQTYTIDLNYRHPLHAIFINFGGRYFRNNINLLYGYDYLGNLRIKTAYAIPNNVSGYNFQGRLSKGTDRIASTFTLEASYSHTSNSQIVLGQLTQYRNQTYLIKPGIATKIKSWAAIQYDFLYMVSQNTIPDQANPLAAIRSHTQHTQVNLFPLKGLNIHMAHEYFYSNAIAAGNRNIHFADIGAKYKFRQVEFGILYDNIFNARQYISATYNDISTYYSAYDLRPAQILLSIRFRIK